MVQYKDKTVALASGAGKGIGLSNHEGSRSARRHRARRVAQPRAWGDGREGPGKMKKYGARVSVLRTPSPVHKKPPACNLNALSQACLLRSSQDTRSRSRSPNALVAWIECSETWSRCESRWKPGSKANSATGTSFRG